MTLTFADTYNMIAYLTKSDASEGFNQIINFLNGSPIKYALTVNPNIYVSCIKQFWTSVDVKKVNDVTSLQALVDRKKVIITKATIRDAICLDDAEGKGCSGVETPRFEEMIVEQQVDEGAAEVHVEDVSTAGVAAESDVSDADDVVSTAVEEPFILSFTSPTPPPQLSQDQPSTSQVKKLERRNKASKLQRLKKVGTAQRIETSDDTVMDDVSKQGRMIANMDADVDVILKDVVVVAKDVQDAKMEESADVQGRKADATINVVAPQLTTAAALTLTTAPSVARRRNGVVIRDPKESATPSTIVYSKAKSKDKGKGILVEEPKPLKKQAQIEQDEAYARELEAKLNKNIDWDKVIDHVQRKQKEDNDVKRYQALKRKPQTEAQARKNMMIYLRNVAGFKMDYFKGMTYDDIRLIFEKHFNFNVAFLQNTKEQMDEEDSRALKRMNECQEDKADKKQKLDEEVKELRKHLIIVMNEDDDVYNEATPLALKVPIVDYKIYTENNKPYYKIKTADGSHQLYLSFLSMLTNFDREDLEVLWQLKNQRSVHGQAKVKSWKLLESCGVQIITFTTTQLILLVERRYPLTRFTLNQMLNNVRLEVEEESEVSLELLRFIRQQHQEGFHLNFGVDAAEEFKENMLSDCCCQAKFMLLINASKSS
nr:hypothetical protein [Tanacetum cinerariifolium]